MDRDNINHQFGDILKKIRETRGFSQEDFALACGISRAYYGRIERGEHSATLDKCKKISDMLGISMSDLFSDLP